MRKTLAATAAIVLALVTGGLTPSTALAAGAPAYRPPAIRWGVCANSYLNAFGAQCGMLTVPLDYAHPRGRKIKLAVSRVVHTSSARDYRGVMLTNAGGPGASGLILSTLSAYVPGGVGKRYDWIGLDPRGVGGSTPSISCDPGVLGYNRPYFVPTTPSLELTWLARSITYAARCKLSGGALIDHVKTTDTIADMESLRKALKASKISYYGFSYGTYVGQVYATLYPHRVRRMVLDGNVDPRGVWYQANLAQNAAFDRNMDIFFAWVAAHDSVYHLGAEATAVKALYYRTMEELRTAPAAGKIGPDEWNDIFVSAGYYVFGWSSVAGAFSRWVNNRNASTLLALYPKPGGAGADNGYAMYLATQCSDVSWPNQWSTWRQDSWRIYADAPFLTWNNSWFNAPCLYWGSKPGNPVRVNGKKAPPILLINETNDAATPYPGALAVRRMFPRAVLVEGVGGTTHAGSLNGVKCTDDTVAAYLATGELPARVAGNRSDRQCDPVPAPTAWLGTAAAPPVGLPLIPQRYQPIPGR